MLEMQHLGSAIVAMTGKLGRLADLNVIENDKVGPIFAKYMPFDRASLVEGHFPLQGGAQGGNRARQAASPQSRKETPPHAPPCGVSLAVAEIPRPQPNSPPRGDDT
jgi:hypothetical protein